MTQKNKRSTFRFRLDEMVAILREEIITGKRSVGDYLPSEVALGEQFGLSKNSVRKGLDVLVAEGFVAKIPRVGNQVARPSTGDRVTVRFGYYPSLAIEADILKLVEQFHAKYPQIRIECIPVPYADDQPTVKDYIVKNMIDVATINYHNFRQFLDSEDHVRLLDPFEPDDAIYPFLMKPFMADGQLRVIPFIFSPVVLCYNKDHFEELSLPEPDSSWTWEDVETLSDKLAGGTQHFGFFYHLLSDNRWPIFLLQSGYVFQRDASNRYCFRDKQVMRGLQISRDLIHKQGTFPFLSESDSDAELLFAQQKVSMIMATYFSLNALRDSDVHFDIAPLPTFHASNTLLLIIGLALNKQTQNKEAAQTFIRFLQSMESHMHIRMNTMSIPGRKKAAEHPRSESPGHPSRFHMYRETIPTFRLYTDLQLSAEELQMIRRELKLYWSKIQNLETVCQRLEETL